MRLTSMQRRNREEQISSDRMYFQVSLSHGTAFIFDGLVAHDTLVDAVATCMDRCSRQSYFIICGDLLVLLNDLMWLTLRFERSTHCSLLTPSISTILGILC
jgi:hypothetical protein